MSASLATIGESGEYLDDKPVRCTALLKPEHVDSLSAICWAQLDRHQQCSSADEHSPEEGDMDGSAMLWQGRGNDYAAKQRCDETWGAGAWDDEGSLLSIGTYKYGGEYEDCEDDEPIRCEMDLENGGVCLRRLTKSQYDNGKCPNNGKHAQYHQI